MLRTKSVMIKKLNYMTATGDEGGITNQDESCTDGDFDFKSILRGFGSKTFVSKNGDYISVHESNVENNQESIQPNVDNNHDSVQIRARFLSCDNDNDDEFLALRES